MFDCLHDEGRVIAYPTKRKMKIYALMYILQSFEKGVDYTEKDVNRIINIVTLFDDPATVRRELYNFRFLDRESDDSRY